LLNQLDRLAQRANSAVDEFDGVARNFDRSSGICVEMQAAYADVQDAWFEYSTAGTARLTAPLDPDRAARDETLYGAVQEIERSFADTGCPRP
jgi:hypothetical protein